MNQLNPGRHSYGAVFLFFILMGLYLKDELIHITMLDMSTGEYGYSRYYIVGMMLVGLFYVFQNHSERFVVRLPRSGTVFNIFIITSYILSILLSFHSSFPLLSDYLARILPIIALYISYCIFQNIKKTERVFTLVFIYAVYLAYYYVTYSMRKLDLVLSEETVNSSVYFLLYLLPVLLCDNRKYLKYPTILIVGAFIILSAKRGGFIAFFLGLVVYIVVGLILANRLKLKHILFACILLLGLVWGISFLQEDETLFIFSRMEGMDSNGYGDRGILYPRVFHMILSSDVISMFLGHGYNSVIKDLGMGYSAHNDFLEIWYDFGLVGFVLYMALWYHIVKMGIKMTKDKSIYAAPYSFMLSIFLVNSMVSHIFLYNQYLMMFSVSFGTMWSLYYREKREIVRRDI